MESQGGGVAFGHITAANPPPQATALSPVKPKVAGWPTATGVTFDGDVFRWDESLQIWVWPNGFQQRRRGGWEVTQKWIESGGTVEAI